MRLSRISPPSLGCGNNGAAQFGGGLPPRAEPKSDPGDFSPSTPTSFLVRFNQRGAYRGRVAWC